MLTFYDLINLEVIFMSNWKPSTFTIEEIVEFIKEKKLTIPPYQRGNVWSSTKEKDLIDSIKKGYPFGSILMYQDDNDIFHLIDGLQRCTTFYRYSSNPAKFFNSEIDVPENSIKLIESYLNLQTGSKSSRESKIRKIINNWVVNNHNNLAEISRMNPYSLHKEIIEAFPIVKDDSEKKDLIHGVLFDLIHDFKEKSLSMSKTEIPTIIYKGAEENLYEVFTRINNLGTKLTKHQIFAASWSVDYTRITSEELSPVLDYVKEFYEEIESVGFGISKDYKSNIDQKNITIYQMIFGFGKYITETYPGLLGKKKKINEVESIGFNLINACLGNKNTNMVNLPTVLRKNFRTDEEINIFLHNIIKIINDVDRIFRKYYSFKLNRRNVVNMYHSEMQIVSIISNLFIINYGKIETDVYGDELISINNKRNRNTKNLTDNFKKWVFRRYLYDNLNNFWSGTGDSKIDEILKESSYYTTEIKQSKFKEVLNVWFDRSNMNKRERVKVPNPNNLEKLLLVIIYMSKFTAENQLDRSKYDIEHLCPKNLLKGKIIYYKNEISLPISSFGNICILPQWDNRKTKDRVIYDDSDYMEKVKRDLNNIEEKYTFTEISMFDFLKDKSLTEIEFQDQYMNFLNERFKIQSEKILNILYTETNNYDMPL